MRRTARLLLERRSAALEQAAGRLRALSPKATLTRGYAIVRKGDDIVRSSAVLTPTDRVDIELAEGRFGAVVDETRI
jgi:exodeoxyribonuclease VII large subunit